MTKIQDVYLKMCTKEEISRNGRACQMWTLNQIKVRIRIRIRRQSHVEPVNIRLPSQEGICWSHSL